jgi:hypothetical protein
MFNSRTRSDKKGNLATDVFCPLYLQDNEGSKERHPNWITPVPFIGHSSWTTPAVDYFA